MKHRFVRFGACVVSLTLIIFLLLPMVALGETVKVRDYEEFADALNNVDANGEVDIILDGDIVMPDDTTADNILPENLKTLSITGASGKKGTSIGNIIDRYRGLTLIYLEPSLDLIHLSWLHDHSSESSLNRLSVPGTLRLNNLGSEGIAWEADTIETNNFLAMTCQLCLKSLDSILSTHMMFMHHSFAVIVDAVPDDVIAEVYETGKALAIQADQIELDKTSNVLIAYNGSNLCQHVCEDHTEEECEHSCKEDNFSCCPNLLLSSLDSNGKLPAFVAFNGARAKDFKVKLYKPVRYFAKANEEEFYQEETIYGLDALNKAIQSDGLRGVTSLHVFYVEPEEDEPCDKIDVSGSVVWVDQGFESYRPESAVSVQLFQNGVAYGNPRQVRNGAFTFKDVPEKDADGKPYEYAVTALDPNKELFSYDITYETENVIRLTIVTFEATTRHLFTLETPPIPMPRAIGFEEHRVDTARVPRGRSYTVSAIPDAELPNYISFSGAEAEKTHTFANMSEDDEHTFHYGMRKINVTGSVVWVDEGFESYRPESAVQVQLIRNDTDYVDQKQVTADAFSFEGLLATTTDGTPFTYTVKVSDPDNDLFSYDISYEPGNVIKLTIVTYKATVNHVMRTEVPDLDPEEDIFSTSSVTLPRGYTPSPVSALEGTALRADLEFAGTADQKTHTFAALSADVEHSFYYNRKKIDISGKVQFLKEDVAPWFHYLDIEDVNIRPATVTVRLYRNGEDADDEISRQTLPVPEIYYIPERETVDGLNEKIDFEFLGLYVADKSGVPYKYGVKQDGMGMIYYETQNPLFGSGDYLIGNELQYVEVTQRLVDRRTGDLLYPLYDPYVIMKGGSVDMWVSFVELERGDSRYEYARNLPVADQGWGGGIYTTGEVEKDTTVTFEYDLCREIAWTHKWVDSGDADRVSFPVSLMNEDGKFGNDVWVSKADSDSILSWVRVYDKDGKEYHYYLKAPAVAVPLYQHVATTNPLRITSTIRTYDVTVIPYCYDIGVGDYVQSPSEGIISTQVPYGSTFDYTAPDYPGYIFVKMVANAEDIAGKSLSRVITSNYSIYVYYALPPT